MLGSYSVIVPVLNRKAELGATLRSIAESMAFFEDSHPRSNEIAGEVVVVDEGSTDGTLDVVREAARRDPRVRLVEHHRSFGIGPARNTGARMAAGEVLFFCDGDDFFLPEHVFVGFSLLDRSATAAGSTAEAIRLRVGERGHLLFSPANPIASLRTGVRLKDRDAIRPEWRAAILETIAQCLCVRRECHDWLEGFPEESVYKRIGGCEDGAYALELATFFRVGVIDLETVEYVRRPGNSLDRQMRRYSHPRGSRFDVATPAQQVLHDIRSHLEHEKVGYLLEKWRVLGLPALAPAFLNWRGVVDELLRRRQPDAATRVAEQAAELGQRLPDEVTTALGTLARTGKPAPDRLEDP
jgi:glycosyltransferase involved in cell wall biosynthesis